MRIVIPKERSPGERRVPMIPSNVKQLVKLGARVEIEKGMGNPSGYTDDEYISAGATISPDRITLLSSADVVLRLHKPPIEDISLLKKGASTSVILIRLMNGRFSTNLSRTESVQ